MMRRSLGNTGFEISPVVYGGIVSRLDGQENSDYYVAWALDHGVNYYDVAPMYGDAQEKLGNSLLGRRNDIYLACKTVQRTRIEAETDLRESLRLLHTDWLDVYQLHEITTDEDVERAFGPGGVMELMRELKEKGVVRKLGVTAHQEDNALKCLQMFDFDTVLFPFNWSLNMGLGIGDRLMAEAKRRGMGVLGMKSMVERRWMTVEEKNTSYAPKSWCKPIDPEDTDFLKAAIQYALQMGVDTIIPPGNFRHFSRAVELIDECLASTPGSKERALLQGALEAVDGRYFFDAVGTMYRPAPRGQ